MCDLPGKYLPVETENHEIEIPVSVSVAFETNWNVNCLTVEYLTSTVPN